MKNETEVRNLPEDVVENPLGVSGKPSKGFTLPVHDHGFVRYIDHMGTDTDIVESARISYASPSKGAEADKKLLGYLLRN